MTITAPDPAAQRSFSSAWSAASATEDLERWSRFLADHGVAWTPEAADRDLVAQLVRSAPARAGEMIELRLEKLANQALERAGDARRVYKQLASGDAPRWVVLSPEERRTLEQSGQRFESSPNPLRQLATIPITLGVYIGADYACRAAGVDERVAWVIALVAYVLTVRVVRGRWPLQPRR